MHDALPWAIFILVGFGIWLNHHQFNTLREELRSDTAKWRKTNSNS